MLAKYLRVGGANGGAGHGVFLLGRNLVKRDISRTLPCPRNYLVWCPLWWATSRAIEPVMR